MDPVRNTKRNPCPPEVEAALKELILSEEELRNLGIKPLNEKKKAAELTPDGNDLLRQRRRTLKNRGYAHAARAKKSLMQRLKNAMMNIVDLDAEFGKIRKETILLNAYMKNQLSEKEKEALDHIDTLAKLEPQNDPS